VLHGTPSTIAPDGPFLNSASPGPKRPFLLAALLAVLTLALFSPAIGFGFVNYDDGPYVYENPHVMNGLTVPGIRYALTTCDIGTWAPLTWISYECDTALLGPRASSYHFTNILLHSITGGLLFFALQSMRRSLWVSFTVAALFLLHPMRTESVAWVAERKDVLCAFFWALGLVAYSLYAARPSWRRWLLLLLCFGAGLLSKMMMVSFPFVLLLLDLWPLNRLACDGRRVWDRIRPLLLEKLPLFGGSVLALFISATALHSRGAFNARGTEGLMGLARVPQNYVFYLEKVFWPVHLSILYPIHPPDLVAAMLGTALLAALTLVALLQARKMPWLIVGWLWFLGVLVPVIGFVPFGDFAVADRYTYIPSIGLILAVMATVECLAIRFGATRWIVAVVVAAVCAVATWTDLPSWRDSMSLFDGALRVGPHYVAFNNRGVALFEAGQIQEAIADYNSAIRLNPRFSRAYNNRGTALSDLGRYDEALRDFDTAIEYDPYLEDAYANRGNVLARKGQPDRALADYNRSLRLNPNRPASYNNRAAAYFQMKRYAEAMADLEACRQLGGHPHPGLAQALAQAHE
jgi:lipoprotein NlpI